MALSNLALFGGAFFTPIIVGKMSYDIGWQWSFYFVAIFSAGCFPLIFFLVRTFGVRTATMYTRVRGKEKKARQDEEEERLSTHP